MDGCFVYAVVPGDWDCAICVAGAGDNIAGVASRGGRWPWGCCVCMNGHTKGCRYFCDCMHVNSVDEPVDVKGTHSVVQYFRIPKCPLSSRLDQCKWACTLRHLPSCVVSALHSNEGISSQRSTSSLRSILPWEDRGCRNWC